MRGAWGEIARGGFELEAQRRCYEEEEEEKEKGC